MHKPSLKSAGGGARFLLILLILDDLPVLMQLPVLPLYFLTFLVVSMLKLLLPYLVLLHSGKVAYIRKRHSWFA